MMAAHEGLFSNMKEKSQEWIKNPVTIGILLVMVLPPVGVLWFMGLGWITLFQQLLKRKGFPLNVSSLFFFGIILSSTVSLFTIPTLSPYVYIPVPLLISGYYGTYLFIADQSKEDYAKWFHSYTVAMIVGGLYIFFFSLFLSLFHLKIPAPFDYLTGRALLGTPPTTRLYGSTFNPNFAAYLLLMVIGFSLVYLLRAFRDKRYPYLLVFLVILVISAIGILETGSRSAFASMLFLFELVLLKVNWKVGLAIVLLPLLRLKWFIHLIPRHGIIDLSYSNRLIIWKASFKIFEQHPLFGVSPAGFSVFYKAIVKKYVPHSHDIFIAFLSEYGLVGEIVFLILTLTMVGYFFIMIVRKANRKGMYTAFFVLTLPNILFTGLLDHPLFSPQVAIPTVVLLAFFHQYALALRDSNKMTM